METDTFTEYRADGWPYCPACGEDELYSVQAILTYPRIPTLAECIANIIGCYACGWRKL